MFNKNKIVYGKPFKRLFQKTLKDLSDDLKISIPEDKNTFKMISKLHPPLED